MRHVGIVLPVPIFTFASPSDSASTYQISSKSDHPRQSYDVISIFQDGGRGIVILLPLSFFVIRSSERSKSTCMPNFGAISQSTAEILLLPVYENKRPPFWNSTSSSNIMLASPSACHFVSAY